MAWFVPVFTGIATHATAGAAALGASNAVAAGVGAVAANAAAGAAIKYGYDKYTEPKREAKKIMAQATLSAEKASAPPTIASADISARQLTDRLRSRKGVLANIYGGASSPPPSVGTKILLGS